MKKGLLLFISILICLEVSAQGRFMSDQPFYSELLSKEVPYALILPKTYNNSNSKYPVIYLTHGLGCTPDSWNDKYIQVEKTIEQLEANGLADFIYVFPTGFNSYYSNTFDGKFPYMDMFIEEFVPFIDKHYRTIANREHRAVVGFSMGGFGAMILPLKNPDIFSISAPLSMSFRTDEQYMAEPLKWWNDQWGSIFGGINKEGEERLTDYYKSHSPFYQFTAENYSEVSKVHWFLHCGDDEEQLLIANDDLHVIMRDNNIKHEYRVSNGGHTGKYWRTALLEVLPYIEFMMNGGKEWNISFLEPKIIHDVKPNQDGGTVIYLAHDKLPKSLVKEIISIVKNDNKDKPLAVLPCDVSKNSLASWIKKYEKKFSFADSQIIALGAAGKEAYELRDNFSRLYFDNASIVKKEIIIEADSTKFWFISQTDNGPFYKDMGSLYKACKKSGANFEYRVRNGIPDARKNILIGIKTIKDYIFY